MLKWTFFAIKKLLRSCHFDWLASDEDFREIHFIYLCIYEKPNWFFHTISLAKCENLTFHGSNFEYQIKFIDIYAKSDFYVADGILGLEKIVD